MILRRTIRCFLLFVLVGAASAGGYTYWIWSKNDAMLHQAVLAQLAELLPEADIEIGRVRFDFFGRIRIYDFTLKPAKTALGPVAGAPARKQDRRQPLLVVPEIVLTVDRQQLNDHQRVDVHKIRLLNPEFHLGRDRSGRWNWEPILPRRKLSNSPPEWAIEQGTVRLQLDAPDGSSSAPITFQQADVKLVPSAEREYLFQGGTQLARTGKLTIEGRYHLDSQAWLMSGQLLGVAASGGLLDWAAAASPELHAHLSQLGAAVVTDSSQMARPAGAASDSLADFGLTGTLDVNFHVSRWQADAKPDFKVLVTLKQGQLTNPALPFPLHDVQGQLYWDNRQVLVHELIAKNGTTRLAIEGKIDRAGDAMPIRLDVNVTDLLLDERLQSRLPADWLKPYNTIRPSGPVDVTGTLTFDGRGQWTPHNFVLTAKRCTVSHVKFPYPVQDVVGTIRQQVETSETFNIEMHGRMGRRTVALDGWVTHPGPQAEALFNAHVERLPLDDAFRSACLPAVQKTLASLKLKGLADIQYRAYRPPGLGQKYLWNTRADVHDGSLQCEAFPYPLSEFRGTATFESTSELWTFADLQASHGPARLTGSGTFRMKRPGTSNEGQGTRAPQSPPVASGGTHGTPPVGIAGHSAVDPGPSSHPSSLIPHPSDGPGLLQLTVTARNAELDKQLDLALPTSLQTVWNTLSPSGKLNVVAKLRWTPGQPPIVSLPEAEVFDASLLMKPFPYPLDNVHAEFSYENDSASPPLAEGSNEGLGRVTVSSFSCRHDETSVSGDGFVEFSPQGDWRVRFVTLNVDDLIPDRPFRGALPQDLRDVVETLDPREPLSLSGMLELRGTGRDVDPVTAAWDLKTVFSGGRATAGVQLEHVYGTASARGTWDGQHLDMAGNLKLESVWAWGHQLTQVQGPYRATERRIVVGSDEALSANIGSDRLQSIPLSDRVTARAIGGLFTLDAEVDFPTQHGLPFSASYHVRMTMNQGRLEQYASRYLPGTNNVRGIMRGWIDLQGGTRRVQGPGSSVQRKPPSQDPGPSTLDSVTGRGQLLISPAALYELPIVVQIFKVLSFVPPDKTAFNHAFLDFTLNNDQFEFSLIDLIGYAISLRGRGTARLDGTLNLEFYSMLPRNRFAIPLVDLVVGEVTDGWVGVKVRGNVNAPEARIIPAPNLEQAIKPFLRTLEGRPPNVLPRLIIPPPRPPAQPQRRRAAPDR